MLSGSCMAKSHSNEPKLQVIPIMMTPKCSLFWSSWSLFYGCTSTRRWQVCWQSQSLDHVGETEGDRTEPDSSVGFPRRRSREDAIFATSRRNQSQTPQVFPEGENLFLSRKTRPFITLPAFRLSQTEQLLPWQAAEPWVICLPFLSFNFLMQEVRVTLPTLFIQQLTECLPRARHL